ncbi:MAG TPA: hypothetical protein VFM25_06015 [Verrucomicrobiae bacterium]|nr:hypothetical protein [Verrucomicrobiae bacterium]
MKTKLILSLTSAWVLTGVMAFAAPVTPNYDTFGTLSDATFGGLGIPNTSVAAVTKIANGTDTITLGLSATPRYSNPALTDIHDGIFHATTGENDGLDGHVPPHSVGATWNFDFYFDATGGSYTYRLYYGTDASSLIYIDPALIGDNAATPNHGGQNSENLDFGAWGTLASFVINPLSFDPNANATYSFELVALNADGTQQLGETAINVVVGTGSPVPDTASSALLLGLGCVGLLAFGFAQKRLQVAANK